MKVPLQLVAQSRQKAAGTYTVGALVFKGFFLISLIFFSSISMAATRATIFPGTGQALIVVQGFDRFTGETDNDPYKLYATMSGPLRKGPSGDEGKVAETNQRDFNLTCVERLQTGTVQCQFVIQESDNCDINPLSQVVTCVWLLEDADEIGKHFHLQQGGLHFVSSDKKLDFSISQNQVNFSFY